jgi:hypothetical protein
MGSEADAATGASQGRYGIQTLLAQKSAAELLATYLGPAKDLLLIERKVERIRNPFHEERL